MRCSTGSRHCWTWHGYPMRSQKMPNNPLPRDVVMLVDDNPDELGMLAEAMEQAGFGVLAAPSGTDALNLLGQAMPNLVVLDAVMPGLDGFETCRRIKSD